MSRISSILSPATHSLPLAATKSTHRNDIDVEKATIPDEAPLSRGVRAKEGDRRIGHAPSRYGHDHSRLLTHSNPFLLLHIIASGWGPILAPGLPSVGVFRRYFGDISDFVKDFRGRSGLLSAATTVPKKRRQPREVA